MNQSGYNTFDFNLNPKQLEFYNLVKGRIREENDIQVIFYGGAIRGGKTSCAISTAILMMKKYPGMRVAIIRDTLQSMKRTSMITFEQICPIGLIKSWNRSENVVKFHNGSTLLFFEENFTHDKALNRFKGLEVNLIILEQLEELQQQTFTKSIERVGTYNIRPMPPPMIFATFNPADNWIRSEIYDKHLNGTLRPKWKYITALPMDNPAVGKDLWDSWSMMPEVDYNMFVLGDWDSKPKEKQFAHCFKKEKHIAEIEDDLNAPIYLSFDFNVNPMTCIAIQLDDEKFHVVEEFRLKNVDIFQMCEQLRAKYLNRIHKITGDASGNNRSNLTNQFGTHYDVIQEKLGLRLYDLDVSSANPKHADSQLLCNIVFSHHPDIKISNRCEYLIRDLKNIEMANTLTIKKSDPDAGHLLDCFRYAINAWAFDWKKYVYAS